ncbi:MAG: hypothetical protein AAFS00_18280, partial [Bacteroidota bacterium]
MKLNKTRFVDFINDFYVTPFISYIFDKETRSRRGRRHRLSVGTAQRKEKKYNQGTPELFHTSQDKEKLNFFQLNFEGNLLLAAIDKFVKRL